MESKDICAVCAWRKDCAKKFSISGKDVRCPDFSKDVTLVEKNREKAETEDKKGK